MKLRIDKRYMPIAATVSVALLLYVAVGLVYPNFFSLRVFVNFFRDNAFLGVVSVGMTLVIISGGIDLSVGSMIAFVGVLCAFLIEKAMLSPLLAFAVALLCGSLIGFTMGSLIHFFKAPPFIVTLAGMFFCRGLANVISLESIPIYNPLFKQIMRFGFMLPGGIKVPSTVLIFLAVLVIFLYVAHYTKFGRDVYAIGGNQQSALLMGLRIGRTKLLIYTLSGLLSSLAGIVYILNTPAGNSLAGVGVELDAIACVVIGGTMLTGGVGFLAGTFVGVLIQAIIKTFLTFSSLSSWWSKIAIGVLI
ncbi:MAG TPA: galactofuranose ABC transporter, permease protein YjfF, partial [Rectinemataceae bacterium]|nr:galactofuranose ABC transporter, permease protein YjfF [Rectinemataceae bacterium]